jgi:hypothetical protein
VTADGFTWTLDPEASNAGRLEVGSVMFVTGRGVGRVIDLADADDGLAVTIAPVEITDIIQDGTYGSTEPVPLDQPILHDSSGAFWADPDVLSEVGSDPITEEDTFPEGTEISDGVESTEPQSLGTGLDGLALAGYERRIAPAAPNLTVPSLPRPPAAAGKVAQAAATQSGAFSLNHSCCSAGTGLGFSYAKNGLKIEGSVKLKMAAPTAQFNLQISGGSIKLAEFRVSGASSLHAEITAATSPQPAINASSAPLGLDVDFAVPIASIAGVPLSVIISQELSVNIFMPGTSTVTGIGDYNLGASLGFRYANGKFSSQTGGSFDADTSVRGSNSISVGISGVTITYKVNFRVGLGVASFNAGVDFAIIVLVTASIGAPIGFNVSQDADDPIERCKNTRGVLKAEYGVGYTIPRPIQAVINFFLEAFNSKPIANKGNYHGSSVIAYKDLTIPKSGLCV